MQDIYMYAVADNTLGTIRDYANSSTVYAPTFTRSLQVNLHLRLFQNLNDTTPYQIESLNAVSTWQAVWDTDFNQSTTPVIIADNSNITVQSVTETINGVSYTFSEIVIPVKNTNTQELITLIGTNAQVSGINMELCGFDSNGNVSFLIQLLDFVFRNRIFYSATPEPVTPPYLTEAQVRALLTAYILLTQKGVANGVATLGEDGKVPSSQVPTIGGITDYDQLSNRPQINGTVVTGNHISEYYSLQDMFQYETAPTPSEQSPDIFQFVGTTASDYTFGYWYKKNSSSQTIYQIVITASGFDVIFAKILPTDSTAVSTYSDIECTTIKSGFTIIKNGNDYKVIILGEEQACTVSAITSPYKIAQNTTVGAKGYYLTEPETSSDSSSVYYDPNGTSVIQNIVLKKNTTEDKYYFYYTQSGMSVEASLEEKTISDSYNYVRFDVQPNTSASVTRIFEGLNEIDADGAMTRMELWNMSTFTMDSAATFTGATTTPAPYYDYLNGRWILAPANTFSVNYDDGEYTMTGANCAKVYSTQSVNASTISFVMDKDGETGTVNICVAVGEASGTENGLVPMLPVGDESIVAGSLLMAGDNGRIATAVNAASAIEGQYVKRTLNGWDTGDITIPVNDVVISGGTSIVSGGTATIPLATVDSANTAGIVKLLPKAFTINSSGQAIPNQGTEYVINNRTNYDYYNYAVALYYLDYAVRSVLPLITTIPAATSAYSLLDASATTNSHSTVYSHAPSAASTYTLPAVTVATTLHEIVLYTDLTTTASLAFQDADGNTITPKTASTPAVGEHWTWLCTYSPVQAEWIILGIKED